MENASHPTVNYKGPILCNQASPDASGWQLGEQYPRPAIPKTYCRLFGEVIEAGGHGHRISDRGLFSCVIPRRRLREIDLNHGASHWVEDNSSCGYSHRQEEPTVRNAMTVATRLFRPPRPSADG